MAGVVAPDTQQLQTMLLQAPQQAPMLEQPEPAVDRFFTGHPGVIAVFDFDYDLIIGFQTKLRWAQFMLCPPAWFSSLLCYPCFLSQNVEWKTRAQHVALTVDGIRYVVDKHPTCCGLSCSDRGRESKTVPYDKITDCDVQEPAGAACCCCIQKVLSQVRVDTASSGSKEGVPQHEVVLEGLRFPIDFKQAVWSMKRGEFPAASNVPLGPTAAAPRVATAPAQASMTNELLTEIRNELRELNSHLRTK